MKGITNYFQFGLGIGTAIIIVLFFKAIKRGVLDIFGGSIDKVELGGIICMIALLKMLQIEGDREHEWQVFNELYILIVGGMAMTGLGLGKVLDVVSSIKGGKSFETKETREVKETKETKSDEL